MLPQLLNAFGETLQTESNAVPETKARVETCLKQLATSSTLQPNFIAALQQLPEGSIKQAIQVSLN
jgi:hypothetical protein